MFVPLIIIASTKHQPTFAQCVFLWYRYVDLKKGPPISPIENN